MINYKELGQVDIIIDMMNAMFRNHDYTGNNSLYTSDGKPTTIIKRVTQQILGYYGLFNVRSITAVFDNIHDNRSTVRHLLYPLYKSNRNDKPEELVEQYDYMKEILNALDIHVIESPSLYEGDDVMGTIAYHLSKDKRRNIIISADGDMMQLVSNYTAFLQLSRNGKDNTLWTHNTAKKSINMKSLKQEFGITSLQFADVKGLAGDSSDNIPGVKGIGLKKALPFIQKYKSLEGLYDEVYRLQNSKADLKNTLFTKNIINKLLEGEDMAFLTRELAMIHRDIKINMEFKRGDFRSDKALEVFRKYEFNELISAFILTFFARSLPLQKSLILSGDDLQNESLS